MLRGFSFSDFLNFFFRFFGKGEGGFLRGGGRTLLVIFTFGGKEKADLFLGAFLFYLGSVG